MGAAALVWAWASWVGNANLDGYHDMLENYAWSQPLRWGTHKHPPFFGWTTGLWFAVFPQNDFFYRLLSYANVLVGLLGVWALGRRLQLGALAPWGALLLLWALPYTNLAGKFNANTQLLSLWPWAAALLLASWQERGWRGAWFSVGLGLVSAACMLSKYYSGLMLAGFLPAVFLPAGGRRSLASAPPDLARAGVGPIFATLVLGAMSLPTIITTRRLRVKALSGAGSTPSAELTGRRPPAATRRSGG